MTAAQRRLVDAAMDRRDRVAGGRGRRAAARERMPHLMLSDSDGDDDDDDPTGGLLAGLKARTRKQYDERRDIDDAEGIDDVSLLLVVVMFGDKY